jgi:divalent metal cation (Fe/Co/Zn/Cd) transporter
MYQKDCYQILGLNCDASDDEIKSACRKLALKYHPDHHPDDSKRQEVVNSFKEVGKIAALNARNSGRFIFVHFDLRLSVKKLKDAYQIANAVEKAIRKEIHFVERVIIHYEPEKKNYVRYAVPLVNREGEISEHFG